MNIEFDGGPLHGQRTSVSANPNERLYNFEEHGMVSIYRRRYDVTNNKYYYSYWKTVRSNELLKVDNLHGQ